MHFKSHGKQLISLLILISTVLFNEKQLKKKNALMNIVAIGRTHRNVTIHTINGKRAEAIDRER